MMAGSSTICLWHYLCARVRALLTPSVSPSKEMSCSLRSSLAGWHRCRSETPSSSPLPRRLSPRCRAAKDYWRTQMVDSVMADDNKVAPSTSTRRYTSYYVHQHRQGDHRLRPQELRWEDPLDKQRTWVVQEIITLLLLLRLWPLQFFLSCCILM